MSRIRSIKPESCLSETLAGVSERAGVVIVYGDEGNKLLQVTNFAEHQHPQKPKKSEFPSLVQYEESKRTVQDEEKSIKAYSPAETIQVREQYSSDTVCSSRSSSRSSSNGSKDKTYVGQARQIITYLNHKTGKNYRHTTKATMRLINARLSEGFTVDDFTAVVDCKCDEWGRDAKMCVFLRPETLFGTKFESYLNQRGPAKKGGGYDQYA